MIMSRYIACHDRKPKFENTHTIIRLWRIMISENEWRGVSYNRHYYNRHKDMVLILQSPCRVSLASAL